MSNATDLFIEIPADQMVFHEGEVGQDLFIIESGTVEILRQAQGAQPIAVLGPGDFFGEQELLQDQPRSTSALAKTAVRLLRIERAVFSGLLKQNVEIALSVMRKLVIRQQHMTQQLEEALTELSKSKPVVTVSATNRTTAPALNVLASLALEPSTSPRDVTVLMLLHAPSGRSISLGSGQDEYLIGRPDPVTGAQPEVDLGPLDHSRTISRRHAKIRRLGDTLTLCEELGTTNGTFINGERIKPGVDVPLKMGDRLRFGLVEVELVSA